MLFSPQNSANVGMNFKIKPLIQEIEELDGERLMSNKSTEKVYQVGSGVHSKNASMGGDNLSRMVKAAMENPRPRP